MHVVTCRRFDFAAAHQLSPGAGLESRLHGHNFTVWIGVTGPLDARTGMVLNVVDLKQIGSAVLDRYDHRLLNQALAQAEPTLPNVARALWADIAGALPPAVSLACLDLRQAGGDGARVTETGAVTVQHGVFSAAHRTYAPGLTEAENQALYGRCANPAGHGHNYRLELTLPAGARADPAAWLALDHVNLSTDVPELAGRNVVTEAIAALIARRTQAAHRVLVWETPAFGAVYQPEADRYAIVRRYRIHAAHRLHSPHLSAEANARAYGKCNRPEPHGHTYQVEATVGGPLDPRTGTAFDLVLLDRLAGEILAPLDYAYLDHEVPALRDRPSTGENIVALLWSCFEARFGSALSRVRLWETRNNRFELERGEGRHG